MRSNLPARILAVDDDPDILELLRYNLIREGYCLTTVQNGEQALSAVESEPPDLILLDLMLPRINGLDVTRRLQVNPRTQVIPIIMLTAKGEEADIVAGLELGAADYIVKPFSVRVLLARIRVVLRRYQAASAEASSLQIEGVEIIPERFEVIADGVKVELTVSEFKILELLAKRRGKIFTRSQIIDAVHGADYAATDRSVDVHIVALRKKLDRYGDLIETIRSVGYRLKD
ncbi:MAG: response regulator transcription factor [Calditrichaeota bacterium]|nr:response regulator transcription factor [Calditrichota bacterium]